MKKGIKKAICAAAAALLMIVFSVAVTGCGEKEPEGPEYEPPKNCDVVLEEKGPGMTPVSAFIGVCDSYDKIREALMSHGLKSWDNDKVREYADEHVEDKSFVVCFYQEGSDGGQKRLREIEVNDGKLTMYIWCERRDYALDVTINHIFIAGVDKSLVANVTECEYVFV